MERHDHPQNAACSEVSNLLPWYANRTLEAEESARVEVHLADCGDCRAELALWREVGEAAETQPEAPFAAPPVETILARIDALATSAPADAPATSGPAEALATRPSARRRAPRRSSGVPGWARAVIGAQTLLAAGLMGVVLLRTPAPAPPGASFETLTTAETPRAEGAALRVAFADDVTLGDLRSLLDEIGGRIGDGPTADGLYTLRLPDLPAAVRALELLRRDARVRRAEPATPQP